ncbi:MAG: phosphoenolpyruvate carboxykinase [Bacteroidales bacterium]|nr:phosphoenolpyruvate carboxykinase [Bacteroidales bacterium]
MKRSSYTIAGFDIAVDFPAGMSAESLLPSFAPFASADSHSEPLLTVTVSALDAEPDVQGLNVLEESVNEFGYCRLYRITEGYLLTVRYACGPLHYATFDTRFTRAEAFIGNNCSSAALSSMLHILFSQAIIPHGGVSLHASAVVLGGKAQLFIGKSGTGKSTHASLWLNAFEGSELLNDDNPVVVVGENNAVVCGSPWSGKTPCYKNECHPLGGIVRLSQSPANRYHHLDQVQAFVTILPSCSAVKADSALLEQLHSNLIAICETVPVGYFECRPDTEAALICKTNLTRLSK